MGGAAAAMGGGMGGGWTGGQHTSAPMGVSGPCELLIGAPGCCMGKGGGMAGGLGQFGNLADVGDHGNLGWCCGHGKDLPSLAASQLSCRKKSTWALHAH